MPTSKMPAELLADSTRYRYGDRDPRAGALHSAQSTAWRRGLSDAAFPESARRTFLDVLMEDPDVVTAVERVGMTFQMVYGGDGVGHRIRGAGGRAAESGLPGRGPVRHGVRVSVAPWTVPGLPSRQALTVQLVSGGDSRGSLAPGAARSGR
jgi:hypothetical protein